MARIPDAPPTDPVAQAFLDTGHSRLEPQMRIGLQHQSRGKILWREPGVEMPRARTRRHQQPQCRRPPVLRWRHAPQGSRRLRGFEFAEGRMGPSDRAGSHGASPCSCSDRYLIHCRSNSRRFQRFHRPGGKWRLCRPSCRTGFPPRCTARTPPPPPRSARPATPWHWPLQSRRSDKTTYPKRPGQARSALMPPDGSAGKNLTRLKPWASACIRSEAVAMPGANGVRWRRPLEQVRRCAGLMPNLTPSPSARARWSAFRIVRSDDRLGHAGHDGFCGLDRRRRTQRNLQHAHAPGDEGLGEGHRVFDPFDGQNRDDLGRPEQRGKYFVFRRHRDALRGDEGPASAMAGMADRGMIAPG